MDMRRESITALLLAAALAAGCGSTASGDGSGPAVPGGPASSAAAPTSTGASPPASTSSPVVTPPTSSTISYLSDLKPSGALAELVTRGPVTISGSMYPKSISFYCNVGDSTAFPAYTLKRNARRFQATIGLAPKSPPQFQAGVLLVGDGRTLRTFNVTVPKPITVDVDVHGVHTLQLECFGGGNSATGGEAVDLAWGNARVSGGN
jgi:hypothetical protein